jgi:hypothetical protein
MIYVILGMHKSGTTLVAQMLQESGIDMGEFNPDLGYDDDNKYERHSTQELNRSLLEGYLIPPLSVLLRRWERPQYDRAGYRKNSDSLALVRYKALKNKLEREQDQRIRDIILACDRAHVDWGFKDPRTCLTYPAWKQHLPDHRLIVVYRSYVQLVHRYLKSSRNIPRLFRILHSWTTYNMAILEHLSSSPAPAIILNYERMMQGDEEVQRLAAFLGCPVIDSRDPNLYRNRAQEPDQLLDMVKFLLPFLPAQPQQIFQTLEERRADLTVVKAERTVSGDHDETK